MNDRIANSQVARAATQRYRIGMVNNLRNRRWGGCVYVLQMFFFVFFRFATKIPDNRSRERLNGFSWIFYQTIAGKMEFAMHRRTKMGARHPINFLGAKNYTLRTWWWRLARESELVCWLWHCAATAVALKRHERANAFNLVWYRPKLARADSSGWRI